MRGESAACVHGQNTEAEAREIYSARSGLEVEKSRGNGSLPKTLDTQASALMMGTYVLMNRYPLVPSQAGNNR
jgi:hypothetical protein